MNIKIILGLVDSCNISRVINTAFLQQQAASLCALPFRIIIEFIFILIVFCKVVNTKSWSSKDLQLYGFETFVLHFIPRSYQRYITYELYIYVLLPDIVEGSYGRPSVNICYNNLSATEMHIKFRFGLF